VGSLTSRLVVCLRAHLRLELVAAQRLLSDARSCVVRRRAWRLAIETAEPSSALT